MQDQDKTKEQLIDELGEMRQRLSAMEAAEARLLGTEKALRESEERFRLLYENAPLAYQSLDENGCLLEVNQAWLDALGYSREEVFGKWVGAFLAPEYLDRLKGNFPKFKAAGEIHGAEFVMLRKNGSRITVEVDGRIGHDRQGQFKQTHCILHDVTERKQTEQALTVREQEYRTLVESIPDLIVRYDTDLRRVYVNPAWEKASGLSAAEVINVHAGDIPKVVNPVNVEYVEKLRQVLETGIPQAIEFSWVNARGVTLFLDYLIVPECDRHGKVVSVLAVGHDLTERKKGEEALRYKTSLLNSLIEALPDAVYFKDMNRRHLLTNKSYQDFFGISGQEVIGKTIEEFVLSDRTGQSCRSDEVVINTKAPLIAEHSWVNRHDDTCIFETRKFPIFDVHGNVIAVGGVSRDITERKRAEKSLSEKSHFIDSLLRAAPIAIFYKDREGRYVGCNDAFTEIMGFSSDEIRGKTVHELWPSELADKYHQMDLELMRNREHQEYEFQVKSKDGEIHPVIFAKDVYLDSHGEVAGLVGAFLDITGRKRAEEALHRLNRELRAISICNQVLVRAVDEQTLLNAICRVICDEAGYRLAWVGYAENDDAKAIRPVAWAGFDSGYIADTKLSWADDTERGRGPAGTVIRSGETIYVQDFTTDPLMAPWRDSALQRGYRSGIALPLKDENTRVFGVLLIYHSEPKAITTEEIRLMEELADDLAFGINGLRTRAERKKAEDALNRANQDWERTFKAISDGIMVLDSEHRILRANKAMADTLGMTEQGLIGKFCFELVHGEKEPPAFCPHSCLLADGEEHSAEVVEARLGATLDVRVSPVLDHNNMVIGSVHVTRDITERKRAEAALRENEQRFRILFDRAPLGIALLGLDYQLLKANKAYCDLLGYSEEELCQLRLGDFTHPDDLEENLRLQGELGSGKVSSFQMEKRFIRKDGETAVGLLVASLLSDDAGLPQYFLGLVLDITERKKSDLALRESEDKFRYVFESANVGKSLTLPTGEIEVNKAFCDLLGYTHEELRNKTWQEITPPEEVGTIQEMLDPLLKGGKDSVRFNKRYIHKNGSYIWGDVSVAMRRDHEGKPLHFVTTVVDITDRKRTDEALRKSEQRLELALQGADLGLWDWSVQTDETVANQRAVEMAGYSLDEIKPSFTFWQGLIHPDDFQRATQKVNDHLEGSTDRYEDEYRVRHKSGDWRWILARGKVTERDPDGKPVRATGTFLDITERKLAEQEQEHLRAQLFQAQKMESIGTLAGGIAHDFNNLLQVIIGYSDMLLFHKNHTDREYEGLVAIRQAGRDGGELAKRILAFSRRLEPDARPVNLNNEIRRVQNMVERTISKMIRVEILLADNLMTVYADPGQMEQILLNLAVNAQHAMPKGGRLTIETANVALDEDYSRTHLDVEPGRYVLLSVSDTGHGMNKGVLEHIFEPFYTTKGPDEGTGLGLAMVFGIVKSHKGHIICYSEPGAGTTFKIYLPAIVQEIEQDVVVTRQMPAFGSETILLVDDEKSIRKLGEQMLRMAGYTVLTATNGREALDIYFANQDRIALVLLDLIMPEMGGKQCLEELLKINPRLRVVIASGYSVNGPTKDAVETGARGFIRKPYETKDLLGTVRKVLDET
jgi:PAS domain S-box-containing protein